MTLVERALRGSYGRAWLDGEEIGILNNIEITVTPNYEDVQVGFLVDRTAVSEQIDGTLSFGAINSLPAALYKKYTKNKNARFVIECNLSDPGADGQEEGYTLTGVSFDTFQLANWESGAIVNKEMAFRVGNFVITDNIA